MREELSRWWRRYGRLTTFGGLALLCAVDLGTGLLSGNGGRYPELVVLGRVGLAVATAALWLTAHRQDSRRLPVWAAVLACASIAMSVIVVLLQSTRNGSGSWGYAETCGLFGVLFVVARRGAVGPGIASVVLGGLALAVLPLRTGTDDVYVITGFFLALCAAAAAAAGAYVRMQATGRERMAAAVRAEQRAEFARDLHDFVAHHVTGIVVQAQGALYVAESDPRLAIAALRQIERAGTETVESMQRMVGVLRTPDTDAPLIPLAGVADLGPLLEGFAESGAPVPRLHVDGDLGGLPVEMSTSAYRVVMEALTNTRRHAADARAVDVRVSRTSDWLLVRVTDDGAAPRTTTSRGRRGYGLLGLTERVKAVGGRISAGPGAAGGWEVDVALPLGEVAR